MRNSKVFGRAILSRDFKNEKMDEAEAKIEFR